jgi:hypothetical protein
VPPSLSRSGRHRPGARPTLTPDRGHAVRLRFLNAPRPRSAPTVNSASIPASCAHPSHRIRPPPTTPRPPPRPR